MKNLFLSLSIAFFSFGIAQTSVAQTYTVEEVNEAAMKKDGKYALMVDNASYLMAAVVTGKEYTKQHSDIEYEVILIGNVVKELAEDKELASFIVESKDFGIRIVVCEFAMIKLGVEKKDLPTTVEITPNGFTYYFGLQELGFNTISL